MSAPEVTDKLVAAIRSGKYDAIICNYANGDMVGHTGVFSAAVKAVEALDICIKRVTDAVTEMGGHCLITADHGNCEQMVDYDAGQAHTQHTTAGLRRRPPRHSARNRWQAGGYRPDHVSADGCGATR